MPRMGNNQNSVMHLEVWRQIQLGVKIYIDEFMRDTMMYSVIITNILISGRSGTEVVTEQLADALRDRGHEVFLFAPHLGALAAQMRARGHIVVDRPGDLPRRPDLIHAHHTAPAMAALASFPGVPALYVCHDATAPFDALPPHPGIHRVLAVDERCRARMLAEGTGAVTLLPNAVDLVRIPRRQAPLPARPRRAVVATKHAGILAAVRAACASAGIALVEIGRGTSHTLDHPEVAFAGADLVFASARTALEAAAAGAGVVVCDGRGLAGFLTHARAEAWLPWNLGAQVLVHPVESGPLAEAIAAWSPSEAAAASALVREKRDLARIIADVETLHAGLLTDTVRPSPEREAAAVGAFIARWVPGADPVGPWYDIAEEFAHLPANRLAAQLNRIEQNLRNTPLRLAWRTLVPEAVRRALR